MADSIKGAIANIGMYLVGIPVGMVADAKGPRPGSIAGSLLHGAGYFFIYRGQSAWEFSPRRRC
jgi:hypothetical protein